MRSLTPIALIFLMSAALPEVAAAHDPAAEEAAPEPIWTTSVGLSYLATGGNSETETLGLDLTAARRPMPWGLEASAQFNRTEQDGAKTAERTYGSLRGTRSLTEVWTAFVGLSAERDEFAGFDLRTVIEAGAAYQALAGPRHRLNLDFALTYTDEDRMPPEPDDSSVGALLGALYKYALSANATVTQGLKYYPNFDDSGDWRAESLTAITAALNQSLALRFSYEVRYRNQPIGLNEDTDTTARASLVWSR